MNDQKPNKKLLPSIDELVSGANKKPQMRGLGDAVARVTDTLRIPKCGACAKRQQALNKLFPFGNSEQER